MKNIITPEAPTFDPSLIDINSAEIPVLPNDASPELKPSDVPIAETEPVDESAVDKSAEVPVPQYASEHDRINQRPNKRGRAAKYIGAAAISIIAFAGGMMARGGKESSAVGGDTKQSAIEVPASNTPTSIEAPVIAAQTTTAPETEKPVDAYATHEYLPGMDKGLNVVYTKNDGYEKSLPKIVGYSNEVIANERQHTEATVMLLQFEDLYTAYMTSGGDEGLKSAMTSNNNTISAGAESVAEEMKRIGPINWNYRYQNVLAEGSGEASFSPFSTDDKKIILLKGVILDYRAGDGPDEIKVLPESDTIYRINFTETKYEFELQPDGSYKLSDVIGGDTAVRVNENVAPATNG